MNSRMSIALCGALLAMWSGCGNRGGGADGGIDGPAPGAFGRSDLRLTVGGVEREFVVYYSESSRGKTDLALVFFFHGSNGSGSYAYGNSGWKEKADEVGDFVAVFPSGLSYCTIKDGNQEKSTEWNNGGLEAMLCQGQVPADDLGFVRAMVDYLQSNYPISTKRRYVAGFSNGGGMTCFLTVRMSDVFAATSPAPGQLAVMEQAAMPISMLAMGGSKDPNLTAPDGLSELPVDESAIQVPGIASTVSAFRDALRLADKYTFSGGANYARFTYTTSTVGATNELQFVVLKGLTHEYPNGQNYPIRAADYSWDFFQRFTR